MTEPGDDAASADEYEARGVGAEVFEAPSVFYLRHADAIQRWAALEGTAREATVGFLDRVVDDYEPVDLAEGWSSATAVETGGKYRHHLFWPADCPMQNDDIPKIAVCFGYHTSRVTVAPGTHIPFVGVRPGEASMQNPWRHEFLRGPGSSALEIREQRGYRFGKEWPVWRPVTSTGPWWDDLDGYRSQVHAAIDEFIVAFGADIERTIRSLT